MLGLGIMRATRRNLTGDSWYYGAWSFNLIRSRSFINKGFPCRPAAVVAGSSAYSSCWLKGREFDSKHSVGWVRIDLR